MITIFKDEKTGIIKAQKFVDVKVRYCNDGSIALGNIINEISNSCIGYEKFDVMDEYAVESVEVQQVLEGLTYREYKQFTIIFRMTLRPIAYAEERHVFRLASQMLFAVKEQGKIDIPKSNNLCDKILEFVQKSLTEEKKWIVDVKDKGDVMKVSIRRTDYGM